MTNPDDMVAGVSVEQCDREAAANFKPKMFGSILAGRCDHYSIVQAFAQHRLAALASSRAVALEEDWQPIETHVMCQAPRKCLIYTERFGVSEGLLQGGGGWIVAAFNGQIISVSPTNWRQLPGPPRPDSARSARNNPISHSPRNIP